MLSAIIALLISAGVPEPTRTAVLISQVAKDEQVNAIVLAKLVIVESRGRSGAINFETGDYGIAQVNLHTHPEYSVTCLLDAKCGLQAGARVFKKAKRLCAYNLGNLGATRHPEACEKYEAKFASL
jgi:hypothetical protein